MRLGDILIVGSAVVLLVSFINRNDLPRSIDYVAAIANEPSQKKSRKPQFNVNYENVEYNIAPEYEYDIVGMIVSYRHHDNNSRMHQQSNDHLNMLDVCVVWGDNTQGALLHKLKFWNGIFTCNVQTRDQIAWDSFDMYQLSNNHLLSDDERIRKLVQKIRIGDQIRVRGYLTSYGSPGIPPRGTSTTRLDTGDGACETIFVESFEILRSATSLWRNAMYGSGATLIIGLFLFFRRPVKVRR